MLRVEQLYPFKEDQLRQLLDGYTAAEQVAWVQEEPENMGAWGFLRPRLTRLLGKEPLYIGRPASAATAVGSHRRHQQEQEELVYAALALKKDF